MIGHRKLRSVSKARLSQRTRATLIDWFKELNLFGWPEVFGKKIEKNRVEIMDEIVHELGMRQIRNNPK